MIGIFASVFLLAAIAFNGFNSQASSSSTVHLVDSALYLKAFSESAKAEECGVSTNTEETHNLAAEGTTAPGCSCKKNKECWSGDCTCTAFPPGGGKVCCRLANDKICRSNDECQSNNCVNGECEDNPVTKDDNRPRGSPCSTNQDCASGSCTRLNICN